MYELLKGLRIVEGASFIAAPSAALHLNQMGAEVIRFDDLAQSPDRGRWPLAPDRSSLYWEGLNKGKKSVALDLSRAEGREIAVQLIAAPGENAGLFVTNYPADGFLSHARLAALRPDLVTLRVMGWADGRQAVDYTVNSAMGIPQMTGPASLGDEPVNHVLPAWDLLAGAYGAFALLAAERNRRAGGGGTEIRLPLSDLALAALGNLGMIAEATVAGRDRARTGNHLFGAFGRDYRTLDGRRIMVVAITQRQWKGLVSALALESRMADIEREHGVSLAVDEGRRYELRDMLDPVFEQAIAARAFSDLAEAFEARQVCWGPYQSLNEAIGSGMHLMTEGLFRDVTHPSTQTYPTPGAPGSLSGVGRGVPASAPMLGSDTERVLSEVLGMSGAHIGALVDQGIIRRPV